MTGDYPAAHSMDTTWFAIDRAGQVAEFFSGEDGDVPAAPTDWEAVARAVIDAGLLEELARHRARAEKAVGQRLEYFMQPNGLVETVGYLRGLPGWDDLYLWRDWAHATRPLFDLPGHLEALARWPQGAVEQGLGDRILGEGRADPFLVVVTDPTLLEEAVAAQVATPLPQPGEGPPWAFRVQPLGRDLAIRLLRSPACLACQTHREGWDDEVEGVVSRGLFAYRHPGGLQSYYRSGWPETPVHVDQLSAVARAYLSHVRFPAVTFDRACYLQPLAHVPCRTWGRRAYFLDVDGRTWRPVPGREEEFAAPEVADLLASFDAEDADGVALNPQEVGRASRALALERLGAGGDVPGAPAAG